MAHNGLPLAVGGLVLAASRQRREGRSNSSTACWIVSHATANRRACWAYGASDVEIDGEIVPADERRSTGLHANAAMRTDTHNPNPDVANVQDHLGAALDEAGPLDPRMRQLVKLGISIGSLPDGAVRSNVRKALVEGATPEEIRQVAILAFTTTGFPTTIAALAWVDEVLDSQTVCVHASAFQAPSLLVTAMASTGSGPGTGILHTCCTHRDWQLPRWA